MAQRLAQRRLERSNSRSNTPRNQLDTDLLSNRGSTSNRSSRAASKSEAPPSPAPSKPSTTLALGALSKPKSPEPPSVAEKGLVALGNLSARDFISRGLEGASKDTNLEVRRHAPQPSPRARRPPPRRRRERATRRYDVGTMCKRSPLRSQVELGQLSARAFIAAGLENTTSASAQQEEVALGQLSARNFIGLGVERAAQGSHGGSTAGATTTSVEDFAQLTGAPPHPPPPGHCAALATPHLERWAARPSRALGRHPRRGLTPFVRPVLLGVSPGGHAPRHSPRHATLPATPPSPPRMLRPPCHPFTHAARSAIAAGVALTSSKAGEEEEVAQLTARDAVASAISAVGIS